MQITLGLHLDGERSWSPANRLGAPTLGPLGFLALLEAQLGLGRDWPGQAERVVQYRDCLKACDSADRFYHQTFALDEIGTAATLLRWRDLWHLHGWDGSMAGLESRRLRDMGEVDACARGKVSASIGERLQGLLEALGTRRPPIAEIALVDPIDAFPSRWQHVLRLFPVREADRLSEAVANGLLGEVQRAVLAVHAGRPVGPIAWRDDGTLLVHRAETRLLAARWMAERLRGERESVLLVAGADGLLLDETLSAADLPRQGFRDANAFRPSLQLLPLAIGLLWEPLDLYGALGFLTHPICPLPRRARWRLAEALANRPGVGGKAWRAALEEISRSYGERATEVRAAIGTWLEQERFEPQRGAPIVTVLACARALSDFFQARLGEKDQALRSAHVAGLAQVTTFIGGLESLQKQGLAVLPRAQLEQLVAQVTSHGSGNALLQAEVGSFMSATEPAVVTDPCCIVIWWQLASPGVHRRLPWSQRELAEFARCGVALPSAEQMLAQEAASWTRPIRAAQHRLELVLPPESGEVHPVWLMLKSLLPGLPVRRLEQVLVAGDPGAIAVLDHRPLPARARWWQIAPGSIPRRESDSFTSLDLLLNDPCQWVLKYAARLRPSDVLAVSDGPLLYGNLAHRLVERAYAQAGALTMEDASFTEWLDVALPQVVSEEGAVLLMPGRRADLERFRARVARAFDELRERLSRARVVQAVPEMPLSGSYAGGSIRGSADLVLSKQGDQRAILDLKWGSTKRYPKLLQENRHLQLALYAELLRQQTGAWPAVAYFLLEAGWLVAPNRSFFPDARVIRPSNAETTAQVWQRFLVTWRWRMDQIEAGRIEVVVGDIEATSESAGPEHGFAIEARNPDYNPFANLVGWRAEP